MREIRGWNVGEVVTAAYMKSNTANLLEEIGSSAEPNLPCIYNGLTLASQSGTGNSIVTFNPGVCRCQDLPLSVFTYLPANPYGTSYPCFIDISALDSNETITLSTGITSGYIVATFAISPTTPNATNYVITGSLLQIATGAYDPTHQVRLCSFVYATSTFTLDFTPGTSRDTDLTGLGGVQWNYQNSSLEIMPPASQGGTAPVNFPTGITTNSFVPPTQQIFNTPGSFMYTTPTSPRLPLYLEVELCAAGGGGSGGGTIGATNGTDGTASEFGFGPLLAADAGQGGTFSGFGGGGGTGVINSPAFGGIYPGQDGQRGQYFLAPAAIAYSSVGLAGGNGGQNLFSGQGLGGSGDGTFAGQDAIANTGCGGGGGSAFPAGPSQSVISGSGGGAGGYIKAIIPNPSGTYSIFLGLGGSAGTGGGGFGGNGGNGADAKLIVTEHYQ